MSHLHSDRDIAPPMMGLMGYFGHDNIGDQAMLECWVNALRALGALDRAVVFSANPEKESLTYGITAVQNVIPTSLYWYAIGLLGRNRKNFIRSLKAFRSCDLLIVGGGSLFHDRPDTSEHLLTLLRRIEMAKNLKQTVLLLGIGVGPVHRDESRRALKRVLSRVDAIAVRDSDSRDLLHELGISGSEIYVTADPTFLLKPPPQERRTEIARHEHITEHAGPKVGICVRSFDLRRALFRTAMADLCRYLLTGLKAGIWLIPMQTGGGEDDRIGARQLAGELQHHPSIHLVEPPYGPVDTIGLISCMDIVVGEKFHSIVFSVLTHTPFLAISYDPKVRSFVHELGHDSQCLNLADIDSARLRSAFDSAWQERAIVRRRLAEVVATISKKSGLHIDILRRYAQLRSLCS